MSEVQNRWLEYFEKALTQLTTYLAKPVDDDRDKAGIIQAFEFSFELLWKVLQKHAGPQGVRIASPKAALSFALQAGILFPNEEAASLQMLEDRNLASHSYDQELANAVYERIRSHHHPLLKSLYLRLEKIAG